MPRVLAHAEHGKPPFAHVLRCCEGKVRHFLKALQGKARDICKMAAVEGAKIFCAHKGAVQTLELMRFKISTGEFFKAKAACHPGIVGYAGDHCLCMVSMLPRYRVCPFAELKL